MNYTEEQKQLAISYLERRAEITSVETGFTPEDVMDSYFNTLEIMVGLKWPRAQDPLRYAEILCEEGAEHEEQTR